MKKALFLIIIIFSSMVVFAKNNIPVSNLKFIELLKNKPITVVAPAAGGDNKIISDLKNIKSLELNFPTECFGNNSELFHGSNDNLRFKCLRNALFTQGDNVIWNLRGGYGSAKLIPYLQQLPKPPKEKFFIGYSDITAMHIFLSQEWGWKPIHGSGIIELLRPEKAQSNFIKIAEIILGKIKQVKIDDLELINSFLKQDKPIIAKLTGGNLTVVETSIGTSWQIKTVDKILFLEDVNIKPYQLDRSLLHLTQAGLLEGVKAVIFGTIGKERDHITVLRNFARNINIPVFKTNRFGHENINDPIIYNTDSKIISNNKDSFSLVMDL